MKTSELIARVKKNAIMPDSQLKYQSSDFIDVLNEKNQLDMAALLLAMNEEHFVEYKFVQIVQDQQFYDLPANTEGWKVRKIEIFDSDHKYYAKCHKIATEQIDELTKIRPGMSTYFYQFVSNKIKLYPIPNDSSYYLKISYYRKPRKLVNDVVVSSPAANAKVGIITSVITNAIDPLYYDITITAIDGSSNVTLHGTGGYDLIRADGQNETYAEAIQRKTGAGYGSSLVYSFLKTDFTAGNDFLPSGRVPTVGDFLCSYNETHIPQIPEEFHPILAQMSARRIVAATGDVSSDIVKLVSDELATMIEAVKIIASNRDTSSPKKLCNMNSIGKAQ